MVGAVLSSIELFPVDEALVGQLSKDVLRRAQRRADGQTSGGDPPEGMQRASLAFRQARTPTNAE